MNKVSVEEVENSMVKLFSEDGDVHYRVYAKVKEDHNDPDHIVEFNGMKVTYFAIAPNDPKEKTSVIAKNLTGMVEGYEGFDKILPVTEKLIAGVYK